MFSSRSGLRFRPALLTLVSLGSPANPCASMSETTDVLWRFVRRDLTAPEFEQWLYQSPELERLLGHERYLELLSADYRDPTVVHATRLHLRSWLLPAKEYACSCVEWQTRQMLPMRAETANLLEEEFRTRRERTPCLKLVECQQCGQHWYVAVDTIDDDFSFLRLDTAAAAAIRERDEWPTDFDGFAHVWGDSDFSGPVRYPWRAPA
jgi:hypothetical protein